MDNPERERIERLLTRVEQDYEYCEAAGHTQRTLDMLTAKHQRLEGKLAALSED